MPRLSDPLLPKRLYICDLAERLEALEHAERKMNAVAYRLYARRLAGAMASYPERLLMQHLGHVPAVAHAIEQQYFERYGSLGGRPGIRARRASNALLGDLMGRPA